MTKNIFLSYNQKSSFYLADKIERRLRGLGINVTRDTHILKTGDSIRSFMKTLQNHDHTICIISDEYLKSTACMYEQILISNVIENRQKLRFMLPLIKNGTQLFSPQERAEIKQHWSKNLQEIQNLLPTNTQTDPDLSLAQNINNSCGIILDSISDTLALTERLLENDEAQFFKNLFAAINEPYPQVYDLLLEAEIIPDREERLLRFDELKQTYQDELLIPLFEAYMLVHDIADLGLVEHKRAERRFNEVLQIKPNFTEALINFSSLYLDYPEKFENAYDKGFDLAQRALGVAENPIEQALAYGNLAILNRRLWGETRDTNNLYSSNTFFKNALLLSPYNVKLNFDYYAFLHDNIHTHPDLSDLHTYHQCLETALQLDPEYILSECMREISLENPVDQNLFLRKIGSRAAAILNDWELKKKYCDEIIQTTAQCVPKNPDHEYDRDSYRAEALSGKAHATLKLGKNSTPSIQTAIDLLTEASSLFEKIGETQATNNAKHNLLNLEKMKKAKSV